MECVEFTGEDNDIQNAVEAIRQFVYERQGNSYESSPRVNSNERNTGNNQRSDNNRGYYQIENFDKVVAVVLTIIIVIISSNKHNYQQPRKSVDEM